MCGAIECVCGLRAAKALSMLRARFANAISRDWRAADVTSGQSVSNKCGKLEVAVHGAEQDLLKIIHLKSTFHRVKYHSSQPKMCKMKLTLFGLNSESFLFGVCELFHCSAERELWHFRLRAS